MVGHSPNIRTRTDIPCGIQHPAGGAGHIRTIKSLDTCILTLSLGLSPLPMIRSPAPKSRRSFLKRKNRMEPVGYPFPHIHAVKTVVGQLYKLELQPRILSTTGIRPLMAPCMLPCSRPVGEDVLGDGKGGSSSSHAFRRCWNHGCHLVPAGPVGVGPLYHPRCDSCQQSNWGAELVLQCLCGFAAPGASSGDGAGQDRH